MKPPFFRIWGAPLILGLLTLAGLFPALIGDDIWDMLSVLALGVPVATATWFGWIKRSNANRAN
jgi:hypothetical protein